MNQILPVLSKEGGVAIRIGLALRQREDVDLLGLRVDTDDGVEAPIGDPRGAIGTDNNAMRRRAFTERDVPSRPGRRIEPAERALRLGRVPDGTVGRRRHVVRMGAVRNGVVANLSGRHRGGEQNRRRNKGENLEMPEHGDPRFTIARGHDDARTRLRKRRNRQYRQTSST